MTLFANQSLLFNSNQPNTRRVATYADVVAQSVGSSVIYFDCVASEENDGQFTQYVYDGKGNGALSIFWVVSTSMGE